MTRDGDDARGASSPGLTWLLGGVVFVAAGLGTFLTQYLSGAYETPDRTIGLVAGSVFVGVASAAPVVVLPLVPLIRSWGTRIARNGQRVLAVVVGLAFALGIYVGLGPQVYRLVNEWSGCALPSEFTVVTTPAVRNTADELLGAFEASTAKANDGCPTAHGFVYDAPEQTIIDTVGRNWATPADRTFFPRRDIGPRPDIWLTESTLPVNTLYDESQTALTSVRSFGLSPVVLAVPSGTAPPTDATLPELVESASATIGVVRPDPIQSTVGLLATAALYGADVDQSPSGPDPAVAEDPAVERRLGEAASARAFPNGDEGALLCRFRELSDSRPALILSEQAVRRFTAGQLVGGPCPGNPPAPTFLATVYAPTPALDHQMVRFGWPEGPATPPVVDDFERWLQSSEGRRAVESTGLRPPEPGDKASANLAERGDLDRRAVANVRLRYLQAQRPRRELLAVDFSGSMKEPGRVPGRTRAEVVQEAVRDAACAGRSTDEIGLWTFPGDSDRSPRPVLPPTREGCDAVAAAMPSFVPRGNTPLLQTIVDGVGSLRVTDDTAERRLVVVTDGEDTSSAVDRADVLAALDGAQVKVYVVTLGDVTCDADPLQEVAERTGGRCYDPGNTADQVRDALGG